MPTFRVGYYSESVARGWPRPREAEDGLVHAFFVDNRHPKYVSDAEKQYRFFVLAPQQRQFCKQTNKKQKKNENNE
jgi:hypothetical protein